MVEPRVERLAHSEANARRMAIIESRFGASGEPLSKPGRVLVGEGVLTKLCRKKAKARQFFLFNDILVYGSIITKKKYSRQHIIPLEDVNIVPLDDDGAWKNGWQIISPKKSFSVFAASSTEKNEWVAHMKKCITDIQAKKSGREQEKKPAAVWVPDSDASICMCCLKTKFNALVRKHHCRKCGNVVCGTCSTKRFILPDIATKALRVCDTCYKDLILPVSQDQGAVGLPPSTFASQLNNTGTRPKQSDQMANYGSSDEDDDDEIPAVQNGHRTFYEGFNSDGEEEGDYSTVY